MKLRHCETAKWRRKRWNAPTEFFKVAQFVASTFPPPPPPDKSKHAKPTPKKKKNNESANISMMQSPANSNLTKLERKIERLLHMRVQ